MRVRKDLRSPYAHDKCQEAKDTVLWQAASAYAALSNTQDTQQPEAGIRIRTTIARWFQNNFSRKAGRKTLLSSNVSLKHQPGCN